MTAAVSPRSFPQSSTGRFGRFVAFESSASNLVPNDTIGAPDVFVLDRMNGTTERINVSTAGLETTGMLRGTRIAHDLPLVAFGSDAPDLVPGDTNGTMDVFVQDFLAGTTERISLDSSGQEVFGGDSWPAAISADGTLVTFTSDAPKLVIRDKNQSMDVFVRDRASTCPPMQVYCTAKTSSLGCKPKVTVSGSPNSSGQTTLFVVGYQFAPDEPGLFFWGTQSKATPFKGGTLCVQPRWYAHRSSTRAPWGLS